MKQCPTCGTTYTDETLRFCLADGAALTGGSDEQATFVRPGSDPMRVRIPQDAPPSSHFQPQPQPVGSSGGGLKIVVAVAALLLLLLVVLGAAGALYYFNTDGKAKVTNVATPSPTNSSSPVPSSSPTPSPKDETSDLKNQIANLEKMINEQKNQKGPANSSTSVPNPPKMGTTARVNSPGDGFLALRSYPSSQVGSRITTIPHGATVSVAGCLNPTGVGNKSGRWCRASYNGFSGWVFDAYLIY